MKIVVVGGSFAGVTAALNIKQKVPNAQVIILEKQETLGFIPGSLAMILKNEAQGIEQLSWITKEQVEKKGIEVRTNTACVRLLPENQLELSTNEILSFDRLVIATGSRQTFAEKNNSPKIKRCNTKQDVLDILKIYKTCFSVAIIGGGQVGLELSEAFYESGKTVHLFESDAHLLGHHFDEEMIAPFEKEMQGKYLTLHLGMFVEKLVETPQQKVRLFYQEESLEVDLVVLANSTRPDNRLWESLSQGEDGTLLVDDYLQTSRQHIFAIGDAISVLFPLTGEKQYLSLIHNAIRTANIVSENILTPTKKDPGTIRVSGNKWFNTFFGSVGLMEKEAVFYPQEITSRLFFLPISLLSKEKTKLKLIFETKSQRLVGAQFISPKNEISLLEQLSMAIRNQQSLPEFLLQERFFQPSLNFPLFLETLQEENKHEN